MKYVGRLFRPRRVPRPRAFARSEVVASLTAVAILLAVVIPVVGAARMSAGLMTSLSNLTQIGAAHTVYAADWNGRQFTLIAEDISAFGDIRGDALDRYNIEVEGGHPPIVLGWGCEPGGACGTWKYSLNGQSGGNWVHAVPIPFPAYGCGGSAYRFVTAKAFHDYMDGRFYSPVFYAPRDTIVWSVAEEAFDSPDEYVLYLDVNAECGDIPAWSSYAFSPAAMFHPSVMRSTLDGGWQDPWSIDEGFVAPSLFQARYPDLKTQMLEHQWNQNRVEDPCNPLINVGSYRPCEPYYFNHALASEPATVFFDLSVRTLPNAEVIAADETVMAATGAGLWSRDTPFGDSGYFGDLSFDGTITSHHILTTDGILGRDTINDPVPSPGDGSRAVATRVSLREGSGR